MAYSDYGGYAYRNGSRIEERSDATISPEGDVFGSPGCWPGFAAMAKGGEELYRKQQNWPSGHAVLGDGPIYLALYKQSSLSLHRAGEQLDILAGIKTNKEEAIVRYGDNSYLNTEHFIETRQPCIFEVEGCRIEAYFRLEDNYYQYVQLTQPNGNVWHGWSGYGVGAGLEDAGYGYSTPERESILWGLFHRPTA